MAAVLAGGGCGDGPVDSRGDSPGAGASGHARIGPNAITRMAEALDEAVGPSATHRLFAACGLGHHLDAPPEHMVDERDVAALHAVVDAALDRHHARAVCRSAGVRTGDYLLAHRIPRPAQRLLRILPTGVAARLLIAAIRRHTWTFAGSGRFHARAGRSATIAIAQCPLCRELTAESPRCDYFAATFERLFRALVHPGARAVETACEASGDDACQFEVRWR